MEYIPFKTQNEANLWQNINCDSCSPKCQWRKNIELYFKTGTINMPTAHHIGFHTATPTHVHLFFLCQNKNNKANKKNKPKIDNHPKLF